MEEFQRAQKQQQQRARLERQEFHAISAFSSHGGNSEQALDQTRRPSQMIEARHVPSCLTLGGLKASSQCLSNKLELKFLLLIIW